MQQGLRKIPKEFLSSFELGEEYFCICFVIKIAKEFKSEQLTCIAYIVSMYIKTDEAGGDQ